MVTLKTPLSFLFYSKGFYDEAVVLLNKAIKGEKKEKGLYINRGGKYTAMIIIIFYRTVEPHKYGHQWKIWLY